MIIFKSNILLIFVFKIELSHSWKRLFHRIIQLIRPVLISSNSVICYFFHYYWVLCMLLVYVAALLLCLQYTSPNIHVHVRLNVDSYFVRTTARKHETRIVAKTTSCCFVFLLPFLLKLEWALMGNSSKCNWIRDRSKRNLLILKPIRKGFLVNYKLCWYSRLNVWHSLLSIERHLVQMTSTSKIQSILRKLTAQFQSVWLHLRWNSC